jgi:diguanylate cyclase (GGDEF)-like protein
MSETHSPANLAEHIQRWRSLALPWVLPITTVLMSVELQRHWGDSASPLHLATVLLMAATWIGILSGREWAKRQAGLLINVAVFGQLAGGALLELSNQPAGAEVLGELEFWAPALCAWWAMYYCGQLRVTIALAGLLYAVIFAVAPFNDGHYFHEHLIQAALVIGVVTFFGRTLTRNAHSSFDVTMHDPLTGVASRPYFEAEIAHTAAMSDRYQQPFSLIAAVIDDFPAHQGRLDRAACDKLLREFAWTLVDRVRQSDTVCHWEGDKFVVLLAGTNGAGALKVAETMRLAVAKAAPDGSKVTASFGVGEHQAGEDPLSSLEIAERALAEARSQGTNRVVSHFRAAVA